MHTLDIITVVVYLLFIISLGVYFGRNQDRKEFFVAGGSMGWLTVGLSVMATLFSSNSFVFYPSAALGDSLKIGLSLVAFALMTPVVIKIFIPIYARLRVETAYEYLEKRYDVKVRSLASGLFILLRIGWMASATYAASVVVRQVSGIDETVIIIGLGIISIVYTMLGGLRAVMWTDVIQFFIFALTILAALLLILSKSNATVAEIVSNYFDGRSGTIVDFELSMSLKYGSWAILIGVFLESLSAFGVDQVAVQRYLAGSDERNIKRGAWLNLA
ncbi:MAG TPA: sodium:solute symporter, partial [Planctomycetaceae bacterium]|nr:sodium:solute symporter [Planctomycetaceae bacterium]